MEDDSPTVLYHALSLKQPWAGLLVAGLKTIEVRRWRTPYRGPLLIHAARVADPRPEAWAQVPLQLSDLVGFHGGILGMGTLTSCKTYRDLQQFTEDYPHHLNPPTWFEPRGLYGFTFLDLRRLPFQPVPGYVRIFQLDMTFDLSNEERSNDGTAR